MQSTMVRVVGSQHQEDGMVERGGRKVAPLGQADADAVANYSADHWADSSTVLGEI